MPVVELELVVEAPAERLFDLSRSVDVHVASTSQTNEQVVDGVRTGLLELGDEVEWQARHLCVTQRLRAKITQFDRPHHFRDSMLRGAFHSFDHDHWFAPTEHGTTMRDHFSFRAPLGPLGHLANTVFLTRYMRRFLWIRANHIKRVAESEEWQTFL